MSENVSFIGIAKNQKQLEKQSYARRASAVVTISRGTKKGELKGYAVNQKVTNGRELGEYITSFSYTGCASGEADRIEINLANRDFRFMNHWILRKKDKITAKIETKYWKSGQGKKTLKCGTFLLDTQQFSGSEESVCVIGAVSIPETSAFRVTTRRKSWKKVTLKEIVRKIAKRYHMSFVFDGPDISVGSIEQSDDTDCSFLTNLCEDYSYGIKMYSGKLIVYSKARYEAKKVVGTIHRKDVKNYDYNTKLFYTGAKMQYNPPDSDDEITVKVGKGNRWLNVPGTADSITQARKKCLGRLNTENECAETIEITILGNTKYHETDTIKLSGFYKLSGKYFVDKVTHSISENGFETQLNLHKVQRRIKK